jgi:hypothetical protein
MERIAQGWAGFFGLCSIHRRHALGLPVPACGRKNASGEKPAALSGCSSFLCHPFRGSAEKTEEKIDKRGTLGGIGRILEFFAFETANRALCDARFLRRNRLRTVVNTNSPINRRAVRLHLLRTTTIIPQQWNPAAGKAVFMRPSRRRPRVS